MSAMLTRVEKICDQIRHRKLIYAAALEADLALLRREHGQAVIDECLRLIVEEEKPSHRRGAHKVQRG
jgi:hypothetical protein